MKTLYLDCSMGAAGDMLTAALLELLPEPEKMTEELNRLGIPGVRYTARKAQKCGITGTVMEVTVNGTGEEDPAAPARHHSSMEEIREILSGMHVSETVREQVLSVYRQIAEAESRVHGVPVEEIHFHEVGALDAVADVAAVCLLLERLAPDRIAASPVCAGSGTVRCAHGILPVPAPATALLLEGIPVYGSDFPGELCTPTGAALLRRFVTDYGPLPPMRISRIGYGLGHKDFPRANCLRAMLGETESAPEEILELSCNVDDMTGEELGYAGEKLRQAGALDVFTVPIGMKKNRPGILLTVLCRPADREKLINAIFLHTGTLGIREKICRRYTLDRKNERTETPLGPVHRKISTGFGVTRCKYEYEDLAAIADRTGMSLEEVRSQMP